MDLFRLARMEEQVFKNGRKLDALLSIAGIIFQEEVVQMATMADLQADVTAQTTVVNSVVTLLNGLSKQLADAIAANDPAAIQAVKDQIDANTAALSAAVLQNTPAAAPAAPAA